MAKPQSTVTLDRESYASADEIARQKGVSRSAVVRWAMQEYAERHPEFFVNRNSTNRTNHFVELQEVPTDHNPTAQPVAQGQ